MCIDCHLKSPYDCPSAVSGALGEPRLAGELSRRTSDSSSVERAGPVHLAAVTRLIRDCLHEFYPRTPDGCFAFREEDKVAFKAQHEFWEVRLFYGLLKQVRKLDPTMDTASLNRVANQ